MSICCKKELAFYIESTSLALLKLLNIVSKNYYHIYYIVTLNINTMLHETLGKCHSYYKVNYLC